MLWVECGESDVHVFCFRVTPQAGEGGPAPQPRGGRGSEVGGAPARDTPGPPRGPAAVPVLLLGALGKGRDSHGGRPAQRGALWGLPCIFLRLGTWTCAGITRKVSAMEPGMSTALTRSKAVRARPASAGELGPRANTSDATETSKGGCHTHRALPAPPHGPWAEGPGGKLELLLRRNEVPCLGPGEPASHGLQAPQPALSGGAVTGARAGPWGPREPEKDFPTNRRGLSPLLPAFGRCS